MITVRRVACLLCLCLLLSLCFPTTSLTVSAAETYEFFSDGQTYTAHVEGPLTFLEMDYGLFLYQCDRSVTGTVVVPETVNGIPVRVLGSYSFNECTGLTGVELPDTITAIYAGAFKDTAFWNQRHLEDGAMYLGDILMSVSWRVEGEFVVKPGTRVIAGSAFTDCSRVERVVLPEGLKEVAGSLFNNCSSLTSVYIPDSVTEIGPGAFWECSALSSLSIPDGVTSIGDSAFHGCSSLTELLLPSALTTIGEGIFVDCSSLTSITIPEKVTKLPSSCFTRCTALTDIRLPGGLTVIEYHAFVGSGFYENPDNWENDVLYLGEYLIEAKPTLTGDYTVKAGTRLLAEYCLRNTPDKHTGLRSITVPESVRYIGIGAFEDILDLETVVIRGPITRLERFVFVGCTSLTSLTLPGTVTAIGEANFEANQNLTITFGGDRAAWEAIAVEELRNDALKTAEIRFAPPTTTAKPVATTAKTTVTTVPPTTTTTESTAPTTGSVTTQAAADPTTAPVTAAPATEPLWPVLAVGGGILLLGGAAALIVWRIRRSR